MNNLFLMIYVFSKMMQIFSTMLLTSFWVFTSSVLNIISTKSLFKEMEAFSIMFLKILPASSQYPILKPLPRF